MAQQQTWTKAIDNTDDYDVVARSDYSNRVTVQENYDSTHPPSQDWMASQPSIALGGAYVRVSKGVPYIFTPKKINGFYMAGEVVGSVRTAAGSITLQIVESRTI